jgi:hypothetical protein
MALALAGCANPSDDATSEDTAAISFPGYSGGTITTNVSALPSAPAPQFTMAADASSLWAGIRDAIKGQCTGMTTAQLEKATGNLVAKSFTDKAAGYESLVKEKQGRDSEGKWLGKVAADEAKYGNTVPTDYPGVLASAHTTAVVGAHNMPGTTIVEYGNAVLTGYQCPSS